MAKYQVVFLGYKDPSTATVQGFMSSFRQAYNLEEAAAIQWLTGKNGVIYEYDDPNSAEQGKQFLESIGGVAEIRTPTFVPPDLEIPKAAPPVVPKTVADAKPVAQSEQTRLCPRCNKVVPQAVPECPYCHVIMDKYLQARSGKPQTAPSPQASASQALSPAGAVAASMARPQIASAEMPIIEIIKQTINIYKSQIAYFLLLSFLSGIPSAIYGFIVGALAVRSLLFAIIVAIVLLPLAFIPSNYCYMTMLKMTDGVIRGESPNAIEILTSLDFYDVVKFTLTYLLMAVCTVAPTVPLIGLMILSAWRGSIGAVVVLGLLTAAAAVVISMFLIFSLPIAALEGQFLVDSIKKSIAMSKDDFWRNLGAVAILLGMVILASIVVMIPFAIIRLNTVGSFLIQIASVPPFMIVMVVLYYDILRRKGT